MKFKTHLHLVPRLRMNGTVPPLSHTPSRMGEKQLYAYLYSSDCDILNNGLEETCRLHFKRIFWELLGATERSYKSLSIRPASPPAGTKSERHSLFATNHGSLQTQHAQGL